MAKDKMKKPFKLMLKTLGILIEGKENISNKTSVISSNSTDVQYPSAKAIYDAIFALSADDVGAASKEVVKLIPNHAVVDGTTLTLQYVAQQGNETEIAVDLFSVEIPESDISSEDLNSAVQAALEEAKSSGMFDGDPGYTPQKGVDYFDGAKGDPGDDYILTEADKTEIAGEAAALVDAALLNLIGEVE